MAAPLPRFRLYGRTRHYAWIAGHALRGGRDDSTPRTRLETDIAARLDIGHAVCVPQDRVGIFLAVRAMVRPGRRIILSPYTLSDVINMVLVAGAEPVFADIDPLTCALDPAAVEALIDDRTDAVMVTHLHGLAADMPAFRALCDRHRLRLLEDCAQAFGSRIDGRSVGTFGDAGIFSFGLYKSVNAIFGGMVVTPHADIAESVRAAQQTWPAQPMGPLLHKAALGAASDLATWPPVFRTLTYRVFRHAFLHDIDALNRTVKIELDPRRKDALPDRYKARMSAVQARLILDQLPRVADHIARRITLARVYDEALDGLREVVRPPMHEDGRHVYTHYALQVPDRHALERHLFRAGRDVAVQHLRNCAALPCFAPEARPCPNAAACAERVVLLATYPGYTADEARRTAAAIRAYYGAGA